MINLGPPVAEPVAAAAASAAASSLHIDYREAALMSALTHTYAPVPLHVGDIWIGVTDNKPALILERKTVSDWESSVMDGRYREQRGRLLAYSQETGARIGYVLEGHWGSASRLGGAKAIMKLVSRMQLIHGIPVFQTASVKETAQLTEALQEAWEKEPAEAFAAASSAQRAVDGIKVVKKEGLDDPRLFAIRCIAQVPGVSPKAAEAILDGCGGTLAAVMRTTAATIADIKVGTRRIGPVVAGRVVALMCGGQPL